MLIGPHRLGLIAKTTGTTTQPSQISVGQLLALGVDPRWAVNTTIRGTSLGQAMALGRVLSTGR